MCVLFSALRVFRMSDRCKNITTVGTCVLHQRCTVQCQTNQVRTKEDSSNNEPDRHLTRMLINLQQWFYSLRDMHRFFLIYLTALYIYILRMENI